MNTKIDSEKYPVLAEYTDPVLPPVRDIIGREQEIKDIRAGLLRAELNNILLLGSPGAGKALTNDTLIPVNDSRLYVPIGKLKYGDEVFDENGNPTKVCGVYPQGELEAWEVEFENGQKVICNDEHMWNVCRVFNDNIRSPFRTMTLGELNELRDAFKRSYLNRLVSGDALNSMNSMGFLNKDDNEYFIPYGSNINKYLDFAVPYGKHYKTYFEDNSFYKCNWLTEKHAYLFGAHAADNFSKFLYRSYNRSFDELLFSVCDFKLEGIDDSYLHNCISYLEDIISESVGFKVDIVTYRPNNRIYFKYKYATGEWRKVRFKDVLGSSGLDVFHDIVNSLLNIGFYFMRGLLDASNFGDRYKVRFEEGLFKGCIKTEKFEKDLRKFYLFVRDLGFEFTFERHRYNPDYSVFDFGRVSACHDVLSCMESMYDESNPLIEVDLTKNTNTVIPEGRDYLKIINIKKLDKKLPMTCIYVDSPTHLYQCTKNHIVTHNTSLVQQVSVETPQWMFLEIDVSRLISKVHDVKQAGTLLKSLFDEAEKYVKQENHELVLFMDEFHQIVNISAAAVEALKPVLAASGARGIRVIAATTFEEFLKYVSENQALVERLQRVNIRQTTNDATITILKEMAKKYEVDNMISDDIYYRIVDYTNRYVPASSQPRKSILVLDGMIGKHRSEQRNMDFELLVDVLKTAQGVDVAFAVDIYKLKDYLNSRVLSQKFAIDQLCDRLGIVTADLNDPKKPLSSILFSGSTGVIACSAYA